MADSEEGYRLVLPQWEPVGGMPPGFEVAASATPNAGIIIVYRGCATKQDFPVGTQDEVIAYLRENMTDEQGIIEAEVGKTASGRDYAYSIVKEKQDPHGVSYELSFAVAEEDGLVHFVTGRATEIGVTGQRDAVIFSAFMMENSPGESDEPFAGWFRDPYDETVTTGFLRNGSEDRKYDELFPGFPLTITRELIDFLAKSN